MNYYTSDLHFGHDNIIRLCNRPWDNIEDMNAGLIRNINERVNRNDVLLILGDVACYRYNPVKDLQQLNCHKVLITGNHDKHWLKDSEFRRCFVDIRETEIIKDGGKKIFLSHYPIAEWDGFYKGIYHFYGHMHNSSSGAAAIMSLYQRAVNVGVDVCGFMPKTADELLTAKEKEFWLPDCSVKEHLKNTVFANDTKEEENS